MESYLITKREAAARLHVSVRYLETQVRHRALAVVRLGRTVRFRIKDIEAFVEAHRLHSVKRPELRGSGYPGLARGEDSAQ
jgi:excisionase family DNA binding protein